MDTDYSQKKLNKRSLFFLIFLIGFSMLVLKITKTNDIQFFKGSSESVICSNEVIDQGYDNNLVFLDMSEDGALTDVTPKTKGSVLGTTCGNALNKYTGTEACTIPGTSDNVSIKGWVNSEANVEIVSITVPIRLLSGIYSVKDSNRNLTYENPVYKPAGELFNKKQILIRSTPGEGNKEMKENIIEGSVTKKAYSTKYTVSSDAAEGGDEVVIASYYTNDCGEKCNNLDNSNPDKSNNVSKKFNRIYYSYPGQKDKDVISGDISIEGECKDVLPANIDSAIPGCFDTGQFLLGLFGSVFPSSDWTNCSKDEEGCVNAEDIVLKISPMFEDTNRFTNTRNKTAMDPVSASTYKSVYVMTPCRINVAGKSVNVKCAWDMSYIFEERKAAEFDDVGGSDTPTHEEYVRFLEKESSTRQDTPLSM
ncbi:MAG TPA: hypothetical protein PKW94_02340 [Candidatus Dojkabacteria bacterium]|nr:hypothetical protein [Candidatus Dojkabacteria bacterium]